MRKIVVIGVNILSVFILCSLSYQPILAKKQFVDIKRDNVFNSNYDCDCEKKIYVNSEPVIICAILWALFLFFLIVVSGVMGILSYILPLDLMILLVNGFLVPIVSSIYAMGLVLECEQFPIFPPDPIINLF